MLDALGRLSITANEPFWLILIPLLLPPLVWISARSLSGLGKARRALAIALRAGVVILIVAALAEVQSVRRDDRMTTLFLLDVSQSIPRDRLAPMLQFVNEAVRLHQRQGDLAGVVVFGKGAKVESPPTPFFSDLPTIESTIDGEYTDLAGALKLALATFPEDTARRIVLLSDGNENRGHALEQALAAKQLDVAVDVLPIEYRYDREVLVERVSVPPDVKKGETVNISVVVRASEPTTGTLQIEQTSDNQTTPAVGHEKPLPVELKRGINVFTVKQTINEPNFYTYTARYVPDTRPGEAPGTSGDRAVNNEAGAFTHARGEANVLLIEGTAGEHAELVQALRAKKIEVKTLTAPKLDGGGAAGGDPLPDDPAELQPFDAVILGDVPKEAFTERQQQLLENNVHDGGAGLIMLGGPDSFGAGGWTGSPVEKALPVDMQIEALKVQGKSALVMVMHATEIPEGNHWMKVIAQEALKTLSPFDYVGVLYWNGQESWLFTLKAIGENKPGMLRAIDRMQPSDMLDFGPSLQMALTSLRGVKDAMTRHIIVISDGDPAKPTNSLLGQLASNKITVTTVLTAAHGNDPNSQATMKDMARLTKGRFYNVTTPKTLPRIYQQEIRLIARPLIFEKPAAWPITLDHNSEPIAGVAEGMPPINGLVLTQVKPSELVDVPLRSPLPSGQMNPVLAHWTYGLGRSVAFTSDAGRRWASAWPTWEGYAAFWSQVVRWSLRPVDKGNLSLTLRREDGQIKVVVDALDKDDRFLNFLQVRGNVVTPDLKRAPVELAQVAPGRYEGTIPDAEARGNYFVNLGYTAPDGAAGLVSSGVSVPYSDEYRELQWNPSTLEAIATATDGKVLAWRSRRDGPIDPRLTAEDSDVFRRDPSLPPPRHFRDLWPNLLWLASLVFLADVAVRRVAPDFARMRRFLVTLLGKLRGREVAAPVDYMQKLKGRKAEVAEQLDRSRSATRFEAPPLPQASRPIGEPLLDPTGEASRPATPPPAPSGPKLAPGEKPAEPESYTNRLLKAKQKVWEDREKEKDKDRGEPKS